MKKTNHFAFFLFFVSLSLCVFVRKICFMSFCATPSLRGEKSMTLTSTSTKNMIHLKAER